MSTVRVMKKEDSQGVGKLWTVADLIVDLKGSGFSDEGIAAYLNGLVIETEIKPREPVTPPQMIRQIIRGIK